jgi:hypothetical protein
MAVIATISAVVAAVGAGFAFGTAAVAFSWTAAAIAFGASLLLSGVSYLLAPKPSKAGFSSYGDGDFTRQFRQAIPERSYIYGECRVSGAIAYIGSTNNNKYLHMVVLLADHEIEYVGELIINDVSVPPDIIDSNGFITAGKYQNVVRIKKHLGSDTQTADSDLVSEVSEWTSQHRLRGIAYLYVRMEFDRNVFQSGIPNISAYIKGKKVIDNRDNVLRYTPNIALISKDYLTDTRVGFSVSASRIENDVLVDSANTCDEIQTTENREFVLSSASTTLNTITIEGDTLFLQTGDRVSFTGANLPEPLLQNEYYYVIPYQRQDVCRFKVASSLTNAIAGTAIDLTTAGSPAVNRRVIKNGEPRYHGGGLIKTGTEIGRNLSEILSGMGGRTIFAGGKYRILSGKYYAPQHYFNESDIVSNISVTTKKSKQNRFNRIKGVYTSQINRGNPSDYPVVQNALYQTEDGEVIERDLTLPFTQRPSTAQRIAKMELERQRQEIIISASFNLKAFKVMAGDNIYISFAKYGWTNKVFEVLEWSIGVDDNDDAPLPIINMTLQENASAVYDWNNGEETLVDPAPNTELPNPFFVAPVTGFSLDSFLVDTQSGDKTYKVKAFWNLSQNQFVLQGGFYELEYKRFDETNYNSFGKVDGTINEIEIPQLQPNINYDIRIRAFNNLRAVSDYVSLYGFTVGSSLTTDTKDWETENLDAEDWETDSLTSENWE